MDMLSERGIVCVLRGMHMIYCTFLHSKTIWLTQSVQFTKQTKSYTIFKEIKQAQAITR